MAAKAKRTKLQVRCIELQDRVEELEFENDCLKNVLNSIRDELNRRVDSALHVKAPNATPTTVRLRDFRRDWKRIR